MLQEAAVTPYEPSTIEELRTLHGPAGRILPPLPTTNQMISQSQVVPQSTVTPDNGVFDRDLNGEIISEAGNPIIKVAIRAR